MTFLEKRQEHSRETAIGLADAVNIMSFDPRAFGEQLSREHRVLQQNAFEAFLGMLEVFSEKYESSQYDLRNEKALELANILWKKVQEVE